MEIKDKQLSALLTLPYSNEQIILKKIAASFLLSTVPFALATLFYISVPSRIPLLFDALSSPVFYLLACLFTFLYFTCMYNALIAKRKRSFIEQLKIIGITAACLLILIIPAIILLANYIVYGTLFVIVLTLIYSNVIFSKVSNWLTVLAQQEN
jgi:ABC-type Na+ efflux pump permease subunit